jgi:hypothetical protein
MLNDGDGSEDRTIAYSEGEREVVDPLQVVIRQQSDMQAAMVQLTTLLQEAVTLWMATAPLRPASPTAPFTAAYTDHTHAPVAVHPPPPTNALHTPPLTNAPPPLSPPLLSVRVQSPPPLPPKETPLARPLAYDANIHGDQCIKGKCFHQRVDAMPAPASPCNAPPEYYQLQRVIPRPHRNPSESSESTTSAGDVVDVPSVSTVGLNNAFTAITLSTSINNWVGGAVLMLAPFAGALKPNVIGAVAKALVPRPAVLKAWIELTKAHTSETGAQLLGLGASTLADNVLRTADPKDKIGYPQYDVTLPVAYYISNFEMVAGANELNEGVKATACAAPLKGSALMVANEYFEARKAGATFAGLKEELISKINFKRTNADKIRFSALKLKGGQSIKDFVQELRLKANQAYATEEDFTQRAIEVRVYEQFLVGLTGELRDATASTSPPDISSAMTAALNAEAHGITRDYHVIHPVACIPREVPRGEIKHLTETEAVPTNPGERQP